jgi:hypothetical protein
MSACHSRMRRAILRRFSSVTISSPSWLSRTSVSMPRIFAARCDSPRRRRASGPPALCQCPMSPLVTATHLNLWPRAAHFAATPDVLSSQSSGWAPKAMMCRTVPGAMGAGVARGAWARAEAADRTSRATEVPSRKLVMPPFPLTVDRGFTRGSRTGRPPFWARSAPADLHRLLRRDAEGPLARRTASTSSSISPEGMVRRPPCRASGTDAQGWLGAVVLHERHFRERVRGA